MIRSNMDEFIGRMYKRRVASKKAQNDTPEEAKSRFIILSKNRAPRKTGETIESIRGKKITDGQYRVKSLVKGTFKQNLWTNGTEPYDRPRMFWNNYRPTRYGDGSHRTTGMPGWWTKSAFDVAKQYNSIALKYVNKSLNVR